jgi:protein-disulfide isomerase
MENVNKSNNDKTIAGKKINASVLKNPWFYVSVVAVIAILILAYMLIKPDQTGITGNVVREENPIQQPQQRQQPSQPEIIDVSIDDDSILGDEDAPVTIIEFSDYECPFCARFYLNTLPQLKREYIDTGKVKLVYRDFPLSFHQNAQKAAEAAECAGEQDKYYEMHDKIFENQQAITTTNLKEYAKEIGLNTNEFNECLDSGEMASEVQKDFQDGQSIGVRGTPTFFINGKLLRGAQPFEEFQKIIEKELA